MEAVLPGAVLAKMREAFDVTLLDCGAADDALTAPADLVHASDGVVLVSRERVDAPVSSVAPDGYRYTFSLAPLSDDGSESFTSGPVRLPVGFGDGTEYRLLRNSIGDRFTFDLVRPPSEQ